VVVVEVFEESLSLSVLAINVVVREELKERRHRSSEDDHILYTAVPSSDLGDRHRWLMVVGKP